MGNILIIYSTVDGHTQRICQVMAQQMRALGATVSICDISAVDEGALTTADKILVGASIRYGKYRPALYQFAKQYQTLLAQKPNGFFSVNVVARKPHKNTPETNPYMQKFLQLSPWRPQQLAVFAGKISYMHYGWFDRSMIRFIMWLTKGPTDLSQTYEFTDWAQVAHFAQQFAES